MRLSFLTAIASTLALTLALPATSALAGAEAQMAEARIAAIAKGDVASLAAAYAPGAVLHWVGGPLDGTYAAPATQGEVWRKFAAAQGAQTARVAALAEAANPKGATVTADVAFAGKNMVKVRYVLVYRGGKVVDEIWQVNPGATY
jgi:hypothetical protein